MAKTINKTQSQTYNFLSENKSIEDIKKQTNIEVIEKSRHGGSTFKIIEKITANEQQLNDDLSENINENLAIVATNLTDNEKEQKPNNAEENLEPVTSNLTNDEKEQEINNEIWTKIKNYLNWLSSNTEELIQTQKNYIEQLEQSNLEKNKENQQLKNEIEKLKQVKHNDINLTKFSYNAITIYDEKQRKNTGIDKIYEEILPINNELYFITTIQNLDNSIDEEVMHFQKFQNGVIKIFKQNKLYDNIDDYKKDIKLINAITVNSNYQYVSIKDFLKKQQDFKLKPTKKEIGKWIISWLIIPVGVITIGLIHPSLLITSVGLGIVGLILRAGAEVFSPTAKKVLSWLSNKWNENEEFKTNNKKEREARIENLTSDKLEIKLQTQYDILKQELNNRKNNNPDELIKNNKINHNSNNISENLNIESENNQNFDSSIKNTVNQQELQPWTIPANTWNKVKCLLT